MESVAAFYRDNAGLIFLAAFLAATIVLVAVARIHLPAAWWAGALVSGLAVTGVATMIALALQGLNPDPNGLQAEGLVPIGVAGVLGAIAGTDVQLAIGAVRARRGGPWTVVAGALLGPVVVIGGYLLLVRSMDWARGIG